MSSSCEAAFAAERRSIASVSTAEAVEVAVGGEDNNEPKEVRTTAIIANSVATSPWLSARFGLMTLVDASCVFRVCAGT